METDPRLTTEEERVRWRAAAERGEQVPPGFIIALLDHLDLANRYAEALRVGWEKDATFRAGVEFERTRVAQSFGGRGRSRR